MDKVLQELLRAGGEYISGERLSEKYGISRAAIWKKMNNLKEKGYVIESVNRKGYRLISTPVNVLNLSEISENLKTEFVGRNFIYKEELDSTNTFLTQKFSELADGSVVFSEFQTMGRGRFGRNWINKRGDSVQMSILLKPDLEPLKAPFTTLIAGAAILKSLREFGVEAFIKWPNDIVLNGKKICGILTEMSLEVNVVGAIIVGIGINVFSDKIDDEISEKATSLVMEGYHISREELVSAVLNNFESMYTHYIESSDTSYVCSIVNRYSAVNGKEVVIERNGEKEKVNCINVNQDGYLVVELANGKIEAISAGEVSVRGKESYI